MEPHTCLQVIMFQIVWCPFVLAKITWDQIEISFLAPFSKGNLPREPLKIPSFLMVFVGGDTTWLNWDCNQFHQEYVLLFANQSSNQYFHGMGQVFCHSSILLGTPPVSSNMAFWKIHQSLLCPPRKLIPRTKHWGVMGMG